MQALGIRFELGTVSMSRHEHAAEQASLDDVVHDLNNAVFAIVMFAELAEAGAPAGHPVTADISEIAKAADRARESLDRLAFLLR